MSPVKIQTHDVSSCKNEIDYFLNYLEDLRFRRASGFGRRSGNSVERNNLSQYEYINTRSVFKNALLKKELYKVTDKLNLTQDLLVNYILRFQPDDFLDWMDYFLWQNSIAILGKFFSIALEDGGCINFKNLASIEVPKYHAIEFSPKHIHSVDKVENRQTWLVLMVPHNLLFNDKII